MAEDEHAHVSVTLDKMNLSPGDKLRKTLKKVLSQKKVLKFLKERSEATGSPIEDLSHKFALEAKESIDNKRIEKQYADEIAKKQLIAENRLMKALENEAGQKILIKTSLVFNGDHDKARASLVEQTRKAARTEAIKVIKERIASEKSDAAAAAAVIAAAASPTKVAVTEEKVEEAVAPAVVTAPAPAPVAAPVPAPAAAILSKPTPAHPSYSAPAAAAPSPPVDSESKFEEPVVQFLASIPSGKMFEPKPNPALYWG